LGIQLKRFTRDVCISTKMPARQKGKSSLAQSHGPRKEAQSFFPGGVSRIVLETAAEPSEGTGARQSGAEREGKGASIRLKWECFAHMESRISGEERVSLLLTGKKATRKRRSSRSLVGGELAILKPKKNSRTQSDGKGLPSPSTKEGGVLIKLRERKKASL